jgi:hypothetical protein
LKISALPSIKAAAGCFKNIFDLFVDVREHAGARQDWQ